MKKIITLLIALIAVFTTNSFAQPGTICNAGFTYLVSPVNGVYSAQFFSANLNTAPVVQHRWWFGDGTAPSYLINPSHAYSPGVYNVVHVVSYRSPNDSNMVSCVDSFNRYIYITDSTPCSLNANFGFLRDSNQTNTVYFTNLSTGTDPNTITRWSFGDGTYSYDSNPSHTYQSSGAYTVCITVQKDSTCTSDTCRTVQVQAPNTCNLQVNFVSGVDSSNHRLVHFYNQSSPVSATDSVTWIFGDGSISNELNPSHTYYQGGTYHVCLVIRRSSPGAVPCVREFCQVLTLPSTPPPPCNSHSDFSFVRDSVQTNTIHFTSLSNDTVPGNSIYWSFGDGTSSAGINPTHTYQTSGAFNVCLYIRRDSTCGADTCKIVQVQVPNNCNLQAYFNTRQDSSNNLLVHFFNQSGGFLPGDSLQWSFGDGSYGTAINPAHTYNQAGTYNVCLTIVRYNTGTVPCVREYCKTITIQSSACNLVANFADSVLNNTVYFYNQSTSVSSADSLLWFFGDGSISRDNNPVHTYDSAGNYNVCLRVSKLGVPNCIDEYCRTITIGQTACNLVADFSIVNDSLNGGSPNSYHFTNTSTPLGSVDSSFWSFGDGSPLVVSPGASVAHSYSAPGFYTVCLWVKKLQPGTINVVCEKSICKTLLVDTIRTQCNLQAYFSYRVDSIANKNIYFTNQTIGIAGTDSIRWTFGDGPSSSALHPQHTYASAGTYQVCLRVTRHQVPGTAPCVDEYCGGIVIQPGDSCTLQSNFSWRTDSSGTPRIYFFNRSTGVPGNAIVTWTFGDGSSSNEWVVDHTYPQAGQYTACLRIVANGGRCISDTCQLITVSGNPQDSCIVRPYFTHYTDSSNRRSIHFTNSSVASPAPGQAHWSFGDGTSGTGWNVEHEYAAAGHYVVCLTITSGNCSSSICDSVSVEADPHTVNCDSLQLGYIYRRDGYMSNKVFFFATGNRPIEQQQWTFAKPGEANAVTLTQRNPVYVFNDTGRYNVCLTASYSNGCVKTYCNTVKINRIAVPAQCMLFAFPNPAHSVVSVNVQLEQAGIITVAVYNGQSNCMRQYRQQGVAGNNLVTLNIHTLPPGFYTVRLMYGGRVCYSRFQKF